MEILLTQAKVAIIDDEDYPLICNYSWHAVYVRKKWYANTGVYVFRKGKKVQRSLRMHTLIMGLGSDHKDGNGLNNRRSNLREATQAQNTCNRTKTKNSSSSKYKGVSWHKRIGKWGSSICLDQKIRHLGYFTDEILAAKRYDEEARKLHGEFAKLNFPDS